MIRRYELVTYDVWGNEKDGWEVNQSFSTGIFINLVMGDDTELLQQMVDGDILTENHEVKIDNNSDDEYVLYLVNRFTEKPVAELRHVEGIF